MKTGSKLYIVAKLLKTKDNIKFKKVVNENKFFITVSNITNVHNRLLTEIPLFKEKKVLWINIVESVNFEELYSHIEEVRDLLSSVGNTVVIYVDIKDKENIPSNDDILIETSNSSKEIIYKSTSKNKFGNINKHFYKEVVYK